MREFKLLLWFVVGLFFGGYSVASFSAAPTSAEAQAAPVGQVWDDSASTGLIYMLVGSSVHGCAAYPSGWSYYSGYWYRQSVSCQFVAVISRQACPSGTVFDSSSMTCGCPSGQELYNGQCVPQCLASQQRNEQGQCYCQQATFQPSFSATLPAGYVIGGTICNNGCEVKSSGGVVSGGFMIGGSWTGVMCSGNPPAKCPLGQAIGYLNDVPFCAPTSGSQQKTVQNGDGSTTTTTTKTDAKGNTIVETRTVGSDGSVQVQTQVFPGNQTGQGSGSGTGDPSGTGGNVGTGDAPTGTGTTGANSGSGTGGDGTCTGDDCGSGGGAFGAPSGQLYDDKTRTLTDSANDFVSAAQQTAVVQSVGGFFSVPNFTGGCPDFGGSIPFFGDSVSLTAGSDWCNWLAWDWIGAALMVLAAWVAFRWGFL